MQPNFDAETSRDEQRVIHILNSLAKCTKALIFLKLAQIDFHNGQFEIISSLNSNETIGVSDAAHRVNVRPSTASKAIEILVRKELLDRFDDPADSRRTLISLTAAGLNAKKSLLNIFDSLEIELFGKMNADEVAGIAETLATVEHRLKSRLVRLR